MIDVGRLGLGCMSMNMGNKDRSIETIRYALDNGITLFNTGEFYGAGQSEMVLREALMGVPRDSFRISVKFGVLPQPGGGIYGLDVNPQNVKAHLAYSLSRLGLDYIDLYQPARMDESIPVEELVGVLADLVQEGYIGAIGLTRVMPDAIRRAAAVHRIDTLEVDYSVANRSIETNGVLDAACEVGARVLTFGALAHGMLSVAPGGTVTAGRSAFPVEEKRAALSGVAEIASEKGTTIEKLAQAYIYAKLPNASLLVGTTRVEHLANAIEALSVEISQDDVSRVEEAFPEGLFEGRGMPDIVFRNGRIVSA